MRIKNNKGTIQIDFNDKGSNWIDVCQIPAQTADDIVFECQINEVDTLEGLIEIVVSHMIPLKLR